MTGKPKRTRLQLLMGTSKNRFEKGKWVECAECDESLLVRLYALRGGLKKQSVCYTHFHSNKVFRGDLIAVLAVITIVAAAFFIYTADYYHSDSSAADVLVSDSRVTVEQPDGNLVFIPASEPG